MVPTAAFAPPPLPTTMVALSLSLRLLFFLICFLHWPGAHQGVLHACPKVCFKTYHHIFVPCREVGKLSLDSDTSPIQTLTRNINRRMLILLEPTEPSGLHLRAWQRDCRGSIYFRPWYCQRLNGCFLIHYFIKSL